MAFDPDAYLNEGKNSSGFDPDAYLGIAPKKVPFTDQLGKAAIDSVKNIASSSMAGAKQVATMGPAAQKTASAMMPVALGLAGTPFGLAAPGAALGEFGREAINTVIDPSNIPQTAMGRFASTIGAGVAQEPKILNAIPGVPQVSEMMWNLASKAGSQAAKFVEATTGLKAKDVAQTAKQGLSTYTAPSMEGAQDIFGQAMAKEGISSRPPLKQVIDPALSTARKVALNVGDKLEKGLDLTAEEALRGRQAIDRIYNATPLTDRATRGNLADLRTSFDDILSNKSGALADASRIYRQSIVKSNILNPFRITKQGQMSAVAPMVATLAASAGLGTGHKEGSALGGLGYLAASSPLLAGFGAAAGGSAAQAINAIGQNPVARQALLQVLQRLTQNKDQQ